MVRDVYNLATPSLTRRAPYDADVITCARIGLIATAAFANHVISIEDIHPPLHEAIYCLTVVQKRIDEGIIPQ
jgi:hypothetical protein